MPEGNPFDAQGIRDAARWIAKRLDNHAMFRIGLATGDGELVETVGVEAHGYPGQAFQQSEKVSGTELQAELPTRRPEPALHKNKVLVRTSKILNKKTL